MPHIKEINYTKAIMKLTKFYISLAVALSTLAGYLIYTGNFSVDSLYSFLGVFFLALGSSALNQYQERKVDANMERTKSRPIPSGKISEGLAVFIILFFVLLGTATLYFLTPMISLILGLLNLLWYNAIYTPLKKVTPFAVVPGSVIGALPPMIGWTAAGGYLWHPDIVFIASFVFVWQIPHFWVLLFKHGEDYVKAGLVSMTQLFTKSQLKNITLVWIFASAVFSLFFPYFNITHSKIAAYAITALSIYTMVFAIIHLKKDDLKPIFKKVFIQLNSFFFFSILILVIDSLAMQ